VICRPFPDGVIGDEDVAIARVDREPFVFAGIGFPAPAAAAAAAARRRQPGFLVSELAQAGAVAVDDIGVGAARLSLSVACLP